MSIMSKLLIKWANKQNKSKIPPIVFNANENSDIIIIGWTRPCKGRRLILPKQITPQPIDNVRSEFSC